MFDKNIQEIIKKTLVVTLTIIVIVAVIMGLWQLQSIVIMVFLAYLLMLALQKPINLLQKALRLPLAGATVITYVLSLIIVLGAVGLLAPIVIKQLYDLIKQINLPTVLPLTNDLGEINLTLNEIGNLLGNAGHSLGQVFSVVSAIFGGLFNVITVVIVSLHMSLDHGNFYKKIFWLTTKESHVKKVKNFLISLDAQLGGWIRGEMLLMLAIGVFSYIGFLIIGIPYALPLAILAAALELLPNLGPIISAVPAIAAALVALGPIPAVITLAFCIILQQLENALLVPKIMKATAEVNPLISILAILIGFTLFGVAGALLALPAYIAVRATYSFWWKNRE
jgi:predicted PurR-regulated permease PerM